MNALARLRVLARLDALRDRPDAELVRLVADRRDEAAFELLVRRHGPLVLGACRRAAGDPAAADDAFQATFLLLATRPPALRDPGGVAGWLYGVAARTAREAERAARRRRRRERRAARPEAVRPPDDSPGLIDAAVRGLPEPYRSAVVLCDLGGLTRDRAAAELGVPLGTVASRLSRGRAMLGAVLTRQGVALPAAGLAVLIPAELAARTVRLGALLATGEAAVPTAVGALLTHGGRRMLPLGLWKVAAGLVAAGGLLLVGGRDRTPADPPAPAAAAKPAAGTGPTPAERLAKLRAEFNDTFAAVTVEVRDPKTGDVTGHMVQGKSPLEQPERFLPTLLELGESADEATAAAALSFAVHAYGMPRGKVPGAGKAYLRLVERFRDSPHLGAFAAEPLQSGPIQPLEEQMLLVATDHAVRGQLEMRLAVAGDPTMRRVVGDKLPPGYDEYRHDLTVVRYRRVVEKYADVDGGKLARQAERRLAALAPPTHLIVGRSAPATAGSDLDGRPMTLADFKGRVVVLEFWGSWCGPCVRATPGLKAVAKEYADRGVVVLGVMAEASAGAARKAVADLGVPWRNWLDVKRDDGSSPIVSAWDVRQFPTTAVIDRDGVIRAVDPGSREKLEKVLDELVAKPAKP